MSFSEGITFEDELALYQAGIAIDDVEPDPEDDDAADATVAIPVTTMRELVGR